MGPRFENLHATAMPAASHRLLVVDDELEFASIIKIVAGEAGFDGRIVGSSAEFEEALEDWQPAVITLDMVMPGRDGLELLSVLSQRAFAGRIVIISGMDPTHLNMAATIATVKKLRLAATVVKPFFGSQLRDVFHALSQSHG